MNLESMASPAAELRAENGVLANGASAHGSGPGSGHGGARVNGDSPRSAPGDAAGNGPTEVPYEPNSLTLLQSPQRSLRMSARSCSL